ncbi:hypothetical protein [Aureivirga sp. CE67]|uniref:hypothetical protein n=1 Tax=Aureivirga sp. CE67 TaxID=1788983 RepID=UPI0018C9A58B|nr:hypothetical protein [Aureivirga sp. CE67]
MEQKEIISNISQKVSEYITEEKEQYEKESSFLKLLIGLSSGSFIFLFSFVFKNNIKENVSNFDLTVITIGFLSMLILLLWHNRAILKISSAIYHCKILYDLQEKSLINKELKLDTAEEIISFKSHFTDFNFIENYEKRFLKETSLYPYLNHKKYSYYGIISLFIIQYSVITKIIFSLIN